MFGAIPTKQRQAYTPENGYFPGKSSKFLAKKRLILIQLV